MDDLELELAIGDTIQVGDGVLLTVVDIEDGEVRFHVEEISAGEARDSKSDFPEQPRPNPPR